uniref:Glucuronosyltransferase n=1 Tax=Bursaphelenchus xylophilus TaxID=6326 RepID=A0A1I7SNX0_BURXY
MQEALKLGIGDVVIPRLVFDAVKNGEWTKLIGQVGEPKQLFPADGYDEIIAPACLYALIHNRSPGPRSRTSQFNFRLDL